MKVSGTQIKQVCQRLRSADPEIYEQFIKLMDGYVYGLIEQVVSAPSDEILVAQGRAQAGQAIFRLLVEQPTTPPTTP